MPARVRPTIGIPLCVDARGRWRAGHRYLYTDALYAQAVERAGAAPLHLPLQADPEGLLTRVDGLLVPGGDDFAPQRAYPDDVVFDLAAPEQIDFDRALVAAALHAGKPVLAICYGMQLLALHAGGTLHAHLPVDVPGCAEHRLRGADARHSIAIEAGTQLERITGARSLLVNSQHHQAVEQPGAGVRVAARAEDGVIEAIEAIGDAFCVGVQWHPERLSGAAGDALFEALVDAARSVPPRARAAG